MIQYISSFRRVGFGLGTTISPYGDTLRQHRKWMQSFIGSSSAMKIIEYVQEVETCRLLYRLLENPDNLMDHLHMSVPSRLLRSPLHGLLIYL